MRRYTIVIVDGDPDDRDYFTAAFHENYSNTAVQVFSSGSAFLEFVRKQSVVPHLVVIAEHMPLPDGLEVIEHMKNDARTRLIPVALVSTVQNAKVSDSISDREHIRYYLKPHHFDTYYHLAAKMMTMIVE